ncbi:MAG: succinate dehydrogenase, hydrophobic membrane anchor protein [Xanthomonadales bacterium]|nr:succinate dehydrogenase, hydrophobic membrane anchor protein [Xanthomonadales bacterium]MCB1626945.1 succinate dehydrogenase, hydrophobic membrane anchor protein [Xanthomonadales bacterium]MCB1640607.1 succinate dehydrogenase, hydrophobic membrane anchor protein [Xanthomonadales bacterium]
MSLQTPLARVRGLGSAKSGTDHWVGQRLTAIVLLPLSLWFLYFATTLVGADYGAIRAAVAQPWSAALLATFVVVVLYHAQLGLQVVIEDYVHVRWAELSLLIAVKFIALLGSVAVLLAVARIALGA